MKRRGTIWAIAAAVLLLGGCRAEDAGTAEQLLADRLPVLEADGILPQRWYAGDHGKKPSVRSQESQSNCWAVAAVSALEASLLPEADTVFSPDHFVYENAFTVDPDMGGSYYMAMAYLSGWQGPVAEADDPYGDASSPEGLAAAVHVQEIQLLENADTGQLKELVYQYGAVQASLYLNQAAAGADASYFNPLTSAYYCSDQNVQDHDIVILGWDDNYSRFLFKEIPDRDGAFICQNSWGGDFGEDGIFYVSYGDANLGAMAAAYSVIEPADNYSDIYQTDDCGWQSSQGYGNETCWFA
ncbi:MAG TPA: cell surface protein, partial [Candidatus Choladousia intestinipullorum]|nr:cell surface protein [Candidatus Choladousia intestinipullorum]